MPLLTGGCFCGELRYEIPVEAVRFGFGTCHCSMCRRLHGAPAVMWLGLAKDNAARFALVKDATATTFLSSPDAKRVFCNRCGTHTHIVYGPGERPWSGELHVATATVDETCIPALEAHIAGAKKPRHVHVYYSDRAACIGDLTAWAAGPKFGGASGTEPLPDAR